MKLLYNTNPTILFINILQNELEKTNLYITRKAECFIYLYEVIYKYNTDYKRFATNNKRKIYEKCKNSVDSLM